MIRRISKIILHCSDSDASSHDNIETVTKWHVVENGWSDIGYHYFIDKSGELFKGREIPVVGAHCRGHNYDSIGICLSGRNEFTESQFIRAKDLVSTLAKQYNIKKSMILPHNRLDPGKTCPNFDILNVLE